MNENNLQSILALKQHIFYHQDIINQTLLTQGQQLHYGYALTFDPSTLLIHQPDSSILNLKMLYRTIQNTSGLYILGPQKYWADGDTYLISITIPSQQWHKSYLITLQEPFNQELVLPPINSSWTIQLNLCRFGSHNQKAWRFYLNADYDSQALTLLNKIPLTWQRHLQFRDIKYLSEIAHLVESYTLNGSTLPSWNQIKRKLNKQTQKFLLNQNKLLSILYYHQGQPLSFTLKDNNFTLARPSWSSFFYWKFFKFKLWTLIILSNLSN